MIRRDFLKEIALAGAAALLPSGLLPAATMRSGLALPAMKLSWQGHASTRPFAMDHDANGKVWFGNTKFFCYDPAAWTTEEIDTAPVKGLEFSTCLCQQNKVYILGQKTAFLHIYDTANRQYSKLPLSDPESNIWYGVRVPGDHRLYLYVRNRAKLVVWDSLTDTGKEIPYPEAMDLWSGFYVPGDEGLYSCTLEAKPARLIRFDLSRQRFDAVIPAPDPRIEFTGMNPIGQHLYCADRFAGRLFAFDLAHRTWSKPVPVPGYRKVFGFIGIGTPYRGKALYCLSTYKGSMKWDFNTNTYLSAGEENIGIDGRPHHFINKYLVFDPDTEHFGFLEAPEAPGRRYPLICYSHVVDERLVITGYDLGNTREGLAPMGTREGELCVFQSV